MIVLSQQSAKVQSRVEILALSTLQKGQLSSAPSVQRGRTVEKYSSSWGGGKDMFGGRSSISSIDGEEKGSEGKKEERRERR